MKTSQAGIDLIKKHESLKLHAYSCPAGKWTIGYGSTIKVTEGMTITPEIAEQRLAFDLDGAETAVNNYVKVPLTQPQFDALVSFVFNVGAGAFQSSTLLRLLNEGDYKGAAAQFKRWEHGGGKVLAGLSKRRKDESIMFMKPLVKSKRVVGGAMAFTGGTTAAVVEVLQQAIPQVQSAISPLSEYLEWAKYAFLALTVAGGALAVYSKVVERRNGVK